MSQHSSRPRSLLLAMIFLLSIFPLSAVNAQPTTPSEFYYGVEYDWQSLDDDFMNLTGLDINGILTEVMEAADDSGFNLDLGQLTTGSTNIYVHQTEDVSPQTVIVDGTSVNVWSRTSDVTIRHGVLFDGVMLSDWSEQTFGSTKSLVDFSVQADLENWLIVDLVYTEYLNNEYKLVGADMDLHYDAGISTGFGMDLALEGGGETFNMDFNTGIDFSQEMQTDSVWRLGTASPVYIEASQNDETRWYCSDWVEESSIETWGDNSEITDNCGTLTGTYDGSMDYAIEFTGLPTEEFNLDAGEFDLSLSDSFSNNGNYNATPDFESQFYMTESLEVNLGDGQSTNVVACEDCPPGNPVMFLLMGEVMGNSLDAFGEAIQEELESSLSDTLQGWFEDFFGSSVEEDDSWYDQDSKVTCSDGTTVLYWNMNDGWDDCEDGADEDVTYATSGGINWDHTEEAYRIYVANYYPGMDEEMFNTNRFTCGNGNEIDFYYVADGDDDCGDGSDEASQFECNDGTMINDAQVNNGEGDCPEYEDEGVSVFFTGTIELTSGNVVLTSTEFTACDSYWLCDEYPYLGTTYLGSNDLRVDSSLEFGEIELCTTLTLEDGYGNQLFDAAETCSLSWVGPEMNAWMWSVDDNSQLNLGFEAWDLDEADVLFNIEVTGPNGDILYSQTDVDYYSQEENYAYDTEYIEIFDLGDYCFEASLTEVGETTPYQTISQCIEVSNEGEPSEKLETIYEAISTSGLENVLKNFVDNLEDRLSDLDTVDTFPYTDAMAAPMWSTEHATIIGVGIYVYDENDTMYTFVGPETTGSSDNLPLKFSIRYLTGVPAQTAQDTSATEDSIDDIVDVSQHDLQELAQVLEEAGVDTSTLDLTNDEPPSSTDDTPATSDAEDAAADGGLLPFISPISIIVMVGLAAFIGRRRED